MSLEDNAPEIEAETADAAKPEVAPERPVTDDRLGGRLRLAGLASLGAGAIHAVAVGMHLQTRGAAVAFTALAVVQIGWGVIALMRPGRLVAVLGLMVGAAAVGGWVVAKTSGISFINGLEEAESVEVADAVCAGLAFVGLLLAAAALLPARAHRHSISLRPPLPLAGLGVAALTVVAMIAAGTGGGHHGAVAAGAAGHHGGDPAAGGTEAAAGHAPSVAVPYDPSLPIDLGGVPGVTPQQQAAAENIVSATLQILPQWSDPAVAEAAGFHSIGDGGTGIEHFVNEEFMEDDVVMDPSRPESLVYNTETGGRRLVAAMYMEEQGLAIEQVPDIGGALMQWHTHQNLCFNDQAQVRGITDGDGNCPAGLVKPEPTPMIHTWIEPHPCGPFAALEGIGGGTIEEGEEVLCDAAHGST